MRIEMRFQLLTAITATVFVALTAGVCGARVVREYYPNGKVMAEVTLTNFTPDGPTKTYYENGKLMSESFYKDGKQEGAAREFYEDGKLRSEATYKDNKPLEKKMYYPGGKIKEIWDYTAVTSPDDSAKVKYYDPQGKYLNEKIIKKKKGRKENKAATAK